MSSLTSECVAIKAPLQSPGWTSALAGDRTARRDRARRLLPLAGNVLVALLYVFFLYSYVLFWLEKRTLISTSLVVFNTMLVACFLTRHRPTAVSASVRNWIIAPLTQVLTLLLRPVGSASWLLGVLSSVGQLAGLALMIASLAALNRSIGIVAANRGIRTRGPYAWMRHPLYTGEIIFLVSFAASNGTFRNALLVCLVILAQMVRARQEEALLIGDERYAIYRAAVPYRFIPGGF